MGWGWKEEEEAGKQMSVGDTFGQYCPVSYVSSRVPIYQITKGKKKGLGLQDHRGGYIRLFSFLCLSGQGHTTVRCLSVNVLYCIVRIDRSYLIELSDAGREIYNIILYLYRCSRFFLARLKIETEIEIEIGILETPLDIEHEMCSFHLIGFLISIYTVTVLYTVADVATMRLLMCTHPTASPRYPKSFRSCNGIVLIE